MKLTSKSIFVDIIVSFFQACERAESSKSCNLIGSESGQYFAILPAAAAGGIGHLH